MRQFILLLGLFLFTCSNAQSPDKLRSQSTELPFASLEDSGFNRDSIENLLKGINTTPHKDFRGLVVIKANKIIIEEYFNTFWRNTIHDIRSAGKSVTAMLLGVAMKEGIIKNLDQNIYSLFPENKYFSINEDYKKINLRHLLDMSSGLDADTDRSQTIGHAGNWIGRDDWREYLLNVPLKSQPGKNWVYADINAVLIGSVIEEASGMSLRDYAQKKLFDPLGIEQVYWYTNAANQTGAAGNLYLSTLDFAKLGVLVVNKGKWDGAQIIDPDYIIELTESKTFDLSGDNPFADSYGMLWYKSNRTFGGKNIDYLAAFGNGGNHLIVLPDEEMVIALTSSAYGQGYAHRRSYTIMSQIIASLK